MPRRRRIAPAGFVYHVMNRAAGRLILVDSSSDYMAFEQLLADAQDRSHMRILAYCLMRTHWHLLLWPHTDRGLSAFMHWLTTAHATRWALAHDAVGKGAVYQSRFKSIPVQTDSHLTTVWRYIERNPLRANLVDRAELWPWSSLSPSRCQRHAPVLAEAPSLYPPIGSSMSTVLKQKRSSLQYGLQSRAAHLTASRNGKRRQARRLAGGRMVGRKGVVPLF